MSGFARPIVQELAGDRLHLQHGPIDIVLKAWGKQNVIRDAYADAVERFATILDECVADLGELRKPMSQAPRPTSSTGRRMTAACQPFSDVFITPMASVAGAVADEVMSAMTAAAGITRAYVNNGGDIAVHVSDGDVLTLGIAGDFETGGIPRTNGRIHILSSSGIGGVATSGARGRSFSLGIADSVTVLARSAALADAAATIIANAVNINADSITRHPARALDPDSDLGDLLVTTAVGTLSSSQIETALAAGVRCAQELIASEIIVGASLMLQGGVEIAGSHEALVPLSIANGVPA